MITAETHMEILKGTTSEAFSLAQIQLLETLKIRIAMLRGQDSGEPTNCINVDEICYCSLL